MISMFTRALLVFGVIAVVSATDVPKKDCDSEDGTCEAEDAALLQTRAKAPADPESSDEAQFKEWMKKYDKTYESKSAESAAYKAFKENLKEVTDHNNDPESTDVWALTENADMTNEEMEDKYLIDLPEPDGDDKGTPYEKPSDGRSCPLTKDWRSILGPVEDQGVCGSCWIFSALGTVEALRAIKGHGWTSLSKQNFVSCGTNACGGGNPKKVIEDLQDGYRRPFTTESWPYVNGCCKFKKGTCLPWGNRVEAFEIGWITGGTVLFEYNKIDRLEWLNYAVHGQPVWFCMSLNMANFEHYSKGIAADWCAENKPDNGHCMVIAGYGHKGYGRSAERYWIIRNSWGTTWGMDGYGYVSDKNFKSCFRSAGLPNTASV